MAGRDEIVSGAEVRVEGQALDPALAAKLGEVRVDQHLMLPDAFTLRLEDPGLDRIDASPFEVGHKVEIRMAGPASAAAQPVFQGQITAVEPEFAERGLTLAVRGYDASHALNRTRARQTYQNMTSDDIARRLAQRAGLTLGTIDAAGAPQDFVQQDNETDWEFLWRLAAAIDFEVTVEGGRFNFRRAGGGAGDGAPVALRWGERLKSFRPRVTGVQQVDQVVVRGWDPASKRAIESSAQPGDLDASIGLARGDVAGKLGGGTVTVVDRPVTSQAEADALAHAVAAHLGNAYVEAEGVAEGDPRLHAGAKVSVDGVGTRFGGTYVLSSVTHVFRRGYRTHFAISGRSSRSLVELMTPKGRRPFGDSIVVGLVTQNQDPEGLGRVRVKYPVLGDDVEGWWARVAAPGAGGDRGLLMLPVAGDEVLVAFEHGDTRRPYVLGALWNGQGKPGALAHTDGSFALRSDHDVTVEAAGGVTITSDRDLTVRSGGATAAEAQSGYTIKAGGQVEISAGATLTLKAPQLTLQGDSLVRVSAPQVMLG